MLRETNFCEAPNFKSLILLRDSENMISNNESEFLGCNLENSFATGAKECELRF